MSADKVLIVTDTLPPDPNGVALIALRTAEIFATHAQVTLLGPHCDVIGNNIAHVPMKRSPLGTDDLRLPRPNLGAILQAVKDSNYVVVHTPGLVGAVGLYFAWRLGKPSTLFLHNDYRQLVRYNLPKILLALGLDLGGQLLEHWAVRSAGHVVAANLNCRYEKAETLKLRPPLFCDHTGAAAEEGVLTLAYHGRVSREKAVDATIQAIAAADIGHKRKRFRIVGAGSLVPAVLGLANSLGVSVEHVPWCIEPRRHLATAQIYVTASREETFSISTLEALGCGLPVIARAVGSIPTYIKHGENGLLFQRDEELPHLIECLAADPAWQRRLGEAARASAVSDTIWAQFAAASVPQRQA